MNLVPLILACGGFAITTFLVYRLMWQRCWVWEFKHLLWHPAVSLCMQQYQERSEWVSRGLGMGLGEVTVILLREAVMIGTAFQSVCPKWARGKQRH